MERHKSCLSEGPRARAARFAIAALQVLLNACTWAVPLPGMIPFDLEECGSCVNCPDCLIACCHVTPAGNSAESPDPPERQLAAHRYGRGDAARVSVEPRARLSPAEKRAWAALIRQFD